MQNITENFKSLSNKGIGAIKDTASHAGDYLKANPTVAAMLLAGGGAGLLGGYLTSRQPEDETESKSQRRMRILRNALLAAGAGAGVVGLGSVGFNRLAEAVPEGSQNPVAEKLTSPIARTLGAAGAGGFSAMQGHKLDKADELAQARRFLNPAHLSEMKGAEPDEVIALADKLHFSPKATGFINPAIGKNEMINKVLRTLVGTTRGGQLGRVGAGVGLMLPEIIGGAKDLILQE